MKHFGTVTIFLGLLVTTVLFVSSKPNPLSLTVYSHQSLSQLIALLGTFLLSVSFILGSRLRFLEPYFGGLDRVYATHRTTSTAAYLFLLYHPLLLILQSLPNLKTSLIYIFPSASWPYTAGILALWLLTLLLIMTVFATLPYHLWKLTHEYMWLTLLPIFYHVLFITSDTSRYLPLRLWLLTVLGIAAAAALFKRFLYTRLGPRYHYLVESVSRLGDIMEITLSPVTQTLPFSPGQFAFFSLADDPTHHHPFSIVSSPLDRQLVFAVKITGDFTLRLKDLQIGQPVTVYGPYGEFGRKFSRAKPTVCIAGGIGITPFVSLINYRLTHQSDQPLFLYYATKSPSEAIYHHTLSTWSSQYPNFTYNLHLSHNSGRLTAALIKTAVADFYRANFFLCGPLPMMRELSLALAKLGIRPSNIIYEDFSFK